MKSAWKLLAAVCALVIGVYAYMARSGVLESASSNAADTHYNLLVQGFRAGQLNLKKDVPPGFAQLADPYDPTANASYRAPPDRMLDLSYYKGRLYLYFGVTPALVLFWPFVVLTGQYLLHRQAVVIFCTMGFLASVGLLHVLWRRYFAEVRVGVVAACALALGLATGVPVLLSQSDVYEVPISCGYMLTMLALAAIWCALHEPERRCWWLVVASVAYGLAVGARPSLLFGAAILLVPVAQTLHERRQIGAQVMSAMGPLMLIGLALMLYNDLRFDNPFEFGMHYQLGGQRHVARQFFGLHYLWFNFRVYFLEPAHWRAGPPFVLGSTALHLPADYTQVGRPLGILTNIPLAWLALAAPVAWRNQSGTSASILRWFVMAVALLFGMCALTLGFYCGASFRYEVDFLPALLLLAMVGILGSEQALADRPVWRRAARWGWGLLLGFSVVFNLLASVEHYAESHNYLGSKFLWEDRVQEAIAQYERALQIQPDSAEAHFNLGNALVRVGKIEEAIPHYEQALRFSPDLAEAHYDLAVALSRTDRLGEAIEQYEQAVQIKPGFAEAHFNLGNALARAGNIKEAIPHYEQALRIQPDFAMAHHNLGITLRDMGKTQDAIDHFEQALRIRPDDAATHYNLGVALEQAGRPQDAIRHYEWALRVKPDFTDAQNALAKLRARH